MGSSVDPGILGVAVGEVPVAVVDIETTGLHAGADRVVEMSVVRVDPGGQPVLAVNTLVNPRRPVAATEIHGITDDDVADAPTFADIAGDVAGAISDAVLMAYNVYFDMRFLTDEFSRVGWSGGVPHACLMYLRPMLGLGSKCCLSDACRAHGVEHRAAHTAAFDAVASARLWQVYAQVMQQRGVRTFADIAALRAYKFVESFALSPLPVNVARSMPSGGRLKPRRVPSDRELAPSRADLVHDYWDAVTAAVADLDISDAEVDQLDKKRESMRLTVEEIRAVHGRVFAAMLGEALSDSLISDVEWTKLRRLHDCLGQLGWAPGM